MAFTPYKLRIEFGGLCMLVQRSSGSPQGLFALMPVMDDRGMEHTQMLLVCDRRYVVGGVLPEPVRLRDRILEWSAMTEHGAPQRMPMEIPSFSSIAGDRPVNPRFFRRGELPACLAARVELPLGSTITIKEGTWVGGVQVEGSPETRPAVGEATVEIVVTEEKFDRIDVGTDEAGNSVVLQPAGTTQNKLLEFKIVSILRDQLIGNCQTEMPSKEPGEEIEHVQAYYHLLENRCENLAGGPRLFVAGKVPEAARAGYRPSILFINPYQCTLGTG